MDNNTLIQARLLDEDASLGRKVTANMSGVRMVVNPIPLAI